MRKQTAFLLTRLEIVTHNARVREMIALGRAAATDPEAAETLAELERSGFYERMLALFAAHGTRSGETVVSFLSDASALLRGLAASLVPLLCSDEQALSAVQNATRRGRVRLLRDLRKHHRFAVVDAFVAQEIAEASENAGDYVPFCSEAFVREQSPTFAERFNFYDWQRLSRAHPDVAAETIGTYLAAQTEPDARLRWRLNAVLPTIAATRPPIALTLLTQALRHESPDTLQLGVLPSYLPAEVADLLLATPARFAVTLGVAQTLRLDPKRLLALLSERAEYLPMPQAYLPHVAPETREKAFAIAGESWKTVEGIIAPAVIAALPARLRVSEARRHFALPALQTRPLSRLPYGAFLPPDEAQIALEPFIKNPDADLRGVALAARVGTARYFADTLPDILQIVRRRENEQDPVRRSLLQAVRQLPPARWQSAHLAELGQIIRDALNAADLSPATAGEVERLIVSLIPFHPVWAAQWLGVLVKERGQVSFYGLESRLTDPGMKAVAPALLPVLKGWATREREYFLLAAVQGFGRRVRVFPEIQEVLTAVVRTSKDSGVVTGILQVYAEHFPKAFAALVPELIQSDKSVVTLYPIYNHLHRHRQDLLMPFLGRVAYAGRFSTGRTRFVLPLASGFHRWIPAQQAVFVQTLTEVSADTGRDTFAIGGVLNQLAALPAVQPTRLLELAQVGTGKTAVRDLAIQALARLDGGQGVPMLIEALSDNRARVAIYALRSLLLEMPAAGAIAVLQNAPMEKVTVAKEVLRLMGELRLPSSLPYLLAQSSLNLHRDVRVALLRALWDYIEKPEAQRVLLAAASDPDPAVASGVLRIPTGRLSINTGNMLRTILATALAHPDATVRMNTYSRFATEPLPDPDRVILPRLLQRLSSPLTDESAAAANAVFEMYNEKDAAAMGQAVTGTLPNRAALTAVLDVFMRRFTPYKTRFPQTIRAVLSALAPDPLTASYQARIAIGGLTGADAATALAGIPLHPEALMSAVAAAEALPTADAAGLEDA
ncbi:MAG: hypothetical protein H7Y38_07575, partial [Armatimonadetes bacterium]|nr:hypothetical protein [Armatimonadota bacterium]